MPTPEQEFLTKPQMHMLDLILIVSKVIYFNKKTLFHEHTDILLTEV